MTTLITTSKMVMITEQAAMTTWMKLHINLLSEKILGFKGEMELDNKNITGKALGHFNYWSIQPYIHILGITC